MTQRVENTLQLAPICTERTSISTFGNKECESKNLEKIPVHLKNSKEEIKVQAFCIPFNCLQIQKKSSNFEKENFDYQKELELANSKSKK